MTLSPHVDEAFAAQAFRSLLGESTGGTSSVLGARVIALEPSHFAALVELPASEWDEEAHVMVGADLLMRAVAAMQLLHAPRDIVISFHKERDYPVLVTAEGARLGILVSSRKSTTELLAEEA